MAEGTKTIDCDEQFDKLSELSRGKTPKLNLKKYKLIHTYKYIYLYIFNICLF